MNLLNQNIIHAYLQDTRCIVLPIIDSTNLYLMQNIKYLQSGDACLAEYQTAGRGRYGNIWISPFGKNIYLSLYWNYKKKYFNIFEISQMTCIVTATVLKNIGTKEIYVKWPNDLYSKNRKLGGILIEIAGTYKSYTHIIVGVGININMNNYSNLSYNLLNIKWINLQDLIYDKQINRNILAALLIKALRNSFIEYEKHGFIKFFPHWNILDYYINKPVILFFGTQEIEGISRGINNQGHLLLEIKGTIFTFNSENISLRGIKK